MATSAYKVLFDGSPATQDQLDLIQTVTVDQEIDMAWEARLEMMLRTAGSGSWVGADQPFAAAFARVRVEVKIGDGSFVALIDGPVVGADTQMSAQPGQSTQTLLVHDDSAYLNRQADVQRFDGMADHEVAQQLFQISQIASTDIETTPAPATSRATSVVQRGTPMQILRTLARRQGKHAYVLPGTGPAQSVGAFKALPHAADGLPELILLGDDRNVATFHVASNLQRPSTVSTSSLDVTDKTVTSATSSFRDLQLLGDQPPPGEQDAAARLAAPGADDAVDPRQLAQGQADGDSFAYTATGSVLGDCYTGVLTPYRAVGVRGLDTPLNGDYVIKKVAHSLTRSQYTQSFELLRNAVATASAGSGLPGGIF